MQTELTRPYFSIWFLNVHSFALPGLQGGTNEEFLGRCGYTGIPKVCSFVSWCLTGKPVTLPKCSPPNNCSGGRDLGLEGTTVARSCAPAPSPRTYSSLLFPQIAETYAFLPREAVTRFLMSCTECQKRMHFNSNGLEPKGKGEWLLPAELTLHFVPEQCHPQLPVQEIHRNLRVFLVWAVLHFIAKLKELLKLASYCLGSRSSLAFFLSFASAAQNIGQKYHRYGCNQPMIMCGWKLQCLKKQNLKFFPGNFVLKDTEYV